MRARSLAKTRLTFPKVDRRTRSMTFRYLCEQSFSRTPIISHCVLWLDAPSILKVRVIIYKDHDVLKFRTIANQRLIALPERDGGVFAFPFH